MAPSAIAPLLVLVLMATPKPRKLNPAEREAVGKVVAAEPEDLGDQTFAVEALGPGSVFLDTGCGGFAVVRGGKAAFQKDGDVNCREAIAAVEFKDLDGDGRTDIVLIEGYLRPSGTMKGGFVFLQTSSGGFTNASERLAKLDEEADFALKDVIKAFGPAKPPK